MIGILTMSLGGHKSRYQSGHIYEASGAFFVRYYVSEIVDAKPTRVQRSCRLCEKDQKYHSRTCKPVKQLAADHMKAVNAKSATVNDQTNVTFWEQTYLPFAKENLPAQNVMFRQMCCVDIKEFRKGVWDDLTKIGQEDVPWVCSQNNVYIAFQFAGRPHERYTWDAEAGDVLKAVTVYHWLAGCL